jgi:alkylation response protein AidB-like acyl-CoA dehydrogenase
MFLPRILQGDVHFAIGYTEPEAGTDLAALRTSRGPGRRPLRRQRARRSSPPAGHDADYVWLACRTDPDGAAHRGLSILIVDTATPATRGRRSSPRTARTT